MRSISRLAAPLAVGVLLAACGVATAPTAPPSAPAFPLAVTDDAGRTVTLVAPPTRIVSLSGAHTETLFALGLADRLVAVDPYSDFPAEARAKPKIGFSQLKPNLEQIVAMTPDLVVTHVEKEPFFQQMDARGIKALKLEPKDFDGIWKDMRMLGKVTGKEARADELIRSLQQRVARVNEKVKAARRPRVYAELDASDPTKPFAAGPGNFIDAMIGVAGGTNIAGNLATAFAQISTEQVVRQDPEVILLADSDVPFNPVKPEDVGRRPGWSGITAVRQQAVRPITSGIASRPGPRIVDALEEIARAIHPELFR